MKRVCAAAVGAERGVDEGESSLVGIHVDPRQRREHLVIGDGVGGCAKSRATWNRNICTAEPAE